MRYGFSLLAAVNLLLLLPTGAAGQEVYAGGGINRFTNYKYILDLVQEPRVYGTFDVGVAWKTSGGEAASMYREPKLGVGFSYATMGSCNCVPGSRLGDSFSLYGFYDRDLLSAGPFSAGYSAELGVAVMTHPYDKYQNPVNLLYGGPLTFHIKGDIYALARVSEHLSIGIEATYRHNSACRLFIPNRGINSYGCSLSARYRIGDARVMPFSERSSDPSLPLNACWRVSVFGAGGIHRCMAEFEADQLLDPADRQDSYTAWFKGSAGLEAVWRYSRRTATGLQLELHYISNTERLRECDNILYGTAEREYSPFAPGLGFVQELYFGPVTAGAGAGVYLYRQVGIHERHSSFYQKVYIRYYPPFLRSWFAGLSLRAHSFTRADYLEFSLGKILFSR